MTKENIYWVGKPHHKSRTSPPTVVLKVSGEGKILYKYRDPENDFHMGLDYPLELVHTLVGEKELIQKIFKTDWS